MSQSIFFSVLRCTECGATCPPDAAYCWMCKHSGVMHATRASLIPAQVCRRCRAISPTDAVNCIQCLELGSVPDAQVVEGNALLGQPLSKGSSQTRSERVSTHVLIGCIVLAILLGIGIGVQDVNLLMFYLILICPAFIAVVIHAVIGRARSGQSDSRALLSTFLWSTFVSVSIFVVVSFIVVLIAIASIIAMIATCFSSISGTGH